MLPEMSNILHTQCCSRMTDNYEEVRFCFWIANYTIAAAKIRRRGSRAAISCQRDCTQTPDVQNRRGTRSGDKTWCLICLHERKEAPICMSTCMLSTGLSVEFCYDLL